jgi:hypothetical protein
MSIPLVLVLLLFGGYLFSLLAVNYNEVQLYWQLKGQNIVETESRRVCATMDGQWYSYDFDIGRSNVVGLRVDPVSDGALAASVALRNFQVRAAREDAWEDVPLTGGQCGNCSATITGEGLDIVPEGEDPWLELPAFAGRQIQGARVEARIHAAKLWPWKWLTAFFSDVEANCAAGLPSRLVIEFN